MKGSLVESVESLTNSCLKLFQLELKDVGGDVLKRTLLYLALFVLINTFLITLTVSSIVFLSEKFNVSLSVMGFSASFFYFLLCLMFFSWIQPSSEKLKAEDSTEVTKLPVLTEDFLYTKEEIHENILNIKAQTLEIINPITVIRKNPRGVAVGTFITGLGIALLTKGRDS